MNEWLLLAAGGMLLYFGAEWFVGGASALAKALRVPPIIIGLTIVAYGTSMPELVVSVQSAFDGRSEIALGNVVGSNIANIGLILGLTALIRPPTVEGSLARRELPLLLVSAAAVPLMLLDGRLSVLEGAVLFAGAVGYTAWMVRAARSAQAIDAVQAAAAEASAVAEDAGAPKPRGAAASALVAFVGLGVLLVGGQFFVRGAVQVAAALGVDDRVIGLTVVAIGTSLPELVTSLIAAKRGHSDIAVGNVVGSNIFNVLLVLGASASLKAMDVTFASMAIDFAAMVFLTSIAAVFIRSERLVTRFEGGAMLAVYVGYTTWLVLKA
jgi:cation:H+ antiporter